MINMHICPECKNIIQYANMSNFLRAEKNNSWCKKTRQNEIQQMLNCQFIRLKFEENI
jgi:hypothetical protein